MQKAKCLFNFPGCGLVISTARGQLMVREASAKVSKLMYSALGLDNIVLHALSPACKEVREQWFPGAWKFQGWRTPRSESLVHPVLKAHRARGPR